MKIVLFILFLFIVSSTSSQGWMNKQENHKLLMCIEEVLMDSVSNTQGEVIWGTDEGDTTRFLLNDKILTFFPVTRKLYRKKSYPTNSEINKFIYNEYGKIKTENLFLRQDYHNELYIIRFSELSEYPGLRIMITCFDYGIPSYYLSWPVSDVCKLN